MLLGFTAVRQLYSVSGFEMNIHTNTLLHDECRLGDVIIRVIDALVFFLGGKERAMRIQFNEAAFCYSKATYWNDLQLQD